MPERIGVIGTGAIGITVGLHLAEHGVEVVFFTRNPRRAQDVEREGLRLLVDHRQLHLHPTAMPLEEAEGQDLDGVILAVKAYDTARVAEKAPDALMDLPWLSLQNGLHHWAPLLERLDPERFTLAATSIAAYRVLPNTVRQTAAGTTVLGPYTPDGDATTALPWARLLQDAGFPTLQVQDVWPYLWRKLLLNAVVNPITALARVPNRGLVDVPDLRELARDLLREAYPVVASRLLPEWDLDHLWEDLLNLLAETGENRSSMFQDLQYGRPTESPWITGVLLNEAAREGIHLVRHETLQRLLEGLQVWQQVEGVHAR